MTAFDRLQVCSETKDIFKQKIFFLVTWSRGATDNASDYGSEDCRFESCRDRPFFFQASYDLIDQKYLSPPGGLEPPTFRLTAERASQLRHGGMLTKVFVGNYLNRPLLRTQESYGGTHSCLSSLRYGLVVRIAGSHPAGPGSIPGNGNPFSHPNLL